MRSASVLVPRSASQQSNGPGTAPDAFWMNPMRSARSSRFTTTIPPTMSLWPFRYLVVECSTMSAPSSSGRWKQGVAKVLSTTNRVPVRCAMSAVARRSHSPIIGFVGVSAKSIRVAGVTAAAMASVSAPSTKANARPSRAHTCVIWRCVPPYTFSPETTWSPAESSFSTASTAARPEPKAKPWRPPSSAATFRSSASRVGLRVRAYSYPLCRPRPSCT